MPEIACPLCAAPVATVPFRIAARFGHRCGECDLVFVRATEHLSAAAECDRYARHQNARSDAGYYQFLARLIVPLESYVQPPATVLDFGSGPAPVLAGLLRSRRYSVTQYDPYFAPNLAALAATYDLVACCETVEHFRDPQTEWGRLISCLNERGALGVMTLLHDDRTDWSSWWYARDATHISFYSALTMRWLAERFAMRLDQIDERVILFLK
ncbi:MAG: class I SAM-dependent methyltransferase [bacterium]|nr:class I SAM-dependent methyltransferase [bacterium]